MRLCYYISNSLTEVVKYPDVYWGGVLQNLWNIDRLHKIAKTCINQRLGLPDHFSSWTGENVTSYIYLSSWCTFGILRVGPMPVYAGTIYGVLVWNEGRNMSKSTCMWLGRAWASTTLARQHCTHMYIYACLLGPTIYHKFQISAFKYFAKLDTVEHAKASGGSSTDVQACMAT